MVQRIDADVKLDALVFAADGGMIGRVTEIRGNVFKVNAPMMPDYWLFEDCIAAVTAVGIQLAVKRDHLDEYKRDPTA